MISRLADQRCFNHGEREAVARCSGCRRFFCRECVTEHDDRVLCTQCLAAITRQARRGARNLGLLLRVGRCLAGLLAAWFFFYMIGEWLVAIPAAFHEMTIWKAFSNLDK